MTDMMAAAKRVGAAAKKLEQAEAGVVRALEKRDTARKELAEVMKVTDGKDEDPAYD